MYPYANYPPKKFINDFGDNVLDRNGKVVSTPPTPLDDGEDWSDVFKYDRIVADEGTTKHRKKFSLLEQAYCKRWRECINMEKWICMDESRVKGWYHSCMTIGPDPKPIRTGATAHTACVGEGPLESYKVWTRWYGGAADTKLKAVNEHTSTALVWINLFDHFLEPYKGQGHHVICDSAYMSDALASIG